jgi:hypothetical protein
MEVLLWVNHCPFCGAGCMEVMLWVDVVRLRGRALAGSFHRVACLARGAGAYARKWVAMGWVPVDMVERIAILGRISKSCS